ncbi:MAG: 50S ribosomal protein L25/general stress protein Ctc [Pseudomonadota bacterium]
MAEADTFHCEPRSDTGTGGARKSRRDGWVPGVLYGGGQDPVAVRLRANEINKAFLQGRLRPQLANIDVPGEDGTQPVIPRDVQIHPVKGLPVHVDFMRVDEKTRINVDVPVRFINEEQSPGLKRGGVLNVVRHAVEVYAPATAIPDRFDIDVGALDIGDGVHASALTLEEGVTLVVTDRDFTIATIAAPSSVRSADDEAEEAEGEEAETEAEDGAEAESDEDESAE